MRTGDQKRVVPWQLLGVTQNGVMKWGILCVRSQLLFMHSYDSSFLDAVHVMHGYVLKLAEQGSSQDFISGYLSGRGYRASV